MLEYTQHMDMFTCLHCTALCKRTLIDEQRDLESSHCTLYCTIPSLAPWLSGMLVARLFYLRLLISSVCRISAAHCTSASYSALQNTIYVQHTCYGTGQSTICVHDQYTCYTAAQSSICVHIVTAQHHLWHKCADQQGAVAVSGEMSLVIVLSWPQVQFCITFIG